MRLFYASVIRNLNNNILLYIDYIKTGLGVYHDMGLEKVYPCRVDWE